MTLEEGHYNYFLLQ